MNTEDDPLWLEDAMVRRSFERAAASYDAAAALHREVAARMAERLGVVRIAPAFILDAGCGTGEAIAELQTRYPDARPIGVDIAYAMASAARSRSEAHHAQRRSLLARLTGVRSGSASSPWLICADIRALPVREGSIDLVWSNLVLEWVNQPARAFEEFYRVLATGGLLSFTTLGPDTLRELRSAFAGVDNGAHVHRFIDMHDLGDMLVDGGFADPVMDMERLTLTYADSASLMRELRALGATNAATGRRRGLTGSRRWRRALGALEKYRVDGRLPATFEIVYGHAWKPAPRIAADGRAIVRFQKPPPR
jgi:malonyl-CoA O-methyltransferase